ncbi:MAG: potassium-transporting ATPase subunit KdpA [Propionibacteriaceae bacterium]|jgi:K+-transporting ATPase ATPase A chain|nr:potassium-transporting ATPase subunit KdpA [Propionibacteriaceae bacterium]
MELFAAVTALFTLVVAVAVTYRPLGDYMAWVFTNPRHGKVESLIYRVCGVKPDKEQTWKGYLVVVLVFSAVGFLMLYGLQRLQPMLPYSLGLGPISPDLAFNTAASYVGNTNWQAYSPEHTTGYAVQMAGLAVQSYVSAAVGFAVAIALVRGLTRSASTTVGNFWVDMLRINLRILLPLSALATVVLIAAGVVQNFDGFTTVETLTGGTQIIPGGPVASQEAIKMLGTNGGGFYNANSAHPFENPSAWVNLFQTYMLIVIPFASIRTFGRLANDFRLARSLLATMAILLVVAYGTLTWFELSGGGLAPQAAGAAMEGKEVRFGIIGSTLFTAATTGTTGGATNSMLGSYTPLGQMVAILHMVLGEVSPGGVGSGLYTLLVLVVIAVFIAGLLVGRTPALLGKRITAREMKLAALVILVMPMLALGGMALSMAIPGVRAEIVANSMTDPDSQGMTELIYAFVSAAINNGSAMAGFAADTPWLNTILGVIILLGRFLVIALVLAMAGSFARQDRSTVMVADLPLHRPQFVVLLVGLIVFIAVPTFFPVLTVGPLAGGLR